MIEGEYFYEIMAHLSDAAFVQNSLSIANEIIGLINRKNLANTPPFEFNLPDFEVLAQPLNATTSLPINLPNTFEIYFDSSFINDHDGDLLRIESTRYNILRNVTSIEDRAAGPIAMISLYRNNQIQKVSGLTIPFNLSFPLDKRIPYIQ